jgi:pantoate--beta-alanine ligase
MEVVRTKQGFREATQAMRRAGASVGLVPTMGALHAGHLSLVEAAAKNGDVPVVSVFVNPLQFGDPDDLARYPRDEAADLESCERAGVGVVFVPDVAEMYPDGDPDTVVQPGPLADVLEGASRPGHFTGVATVVTKLLSLTGPARAYFGEKDYQQLVIVRRIVEDLDLPASVVGCPIVREPDGLAMSSRNRRLSGADREKARGLFRALSAGAALVLAGETSPPVVESAMNEILSVETPRPDYAAARDPERLAPLERIDRQVRLLVAAGVGPVRLIDNLAVSPPAVY